MFLKRIILLFLSTLIFLTGCNAPVYNQSEGNIAEVQERTVAALRQSDAAAKPVPPLVINNGLYVDRTPISISKQPGWLNSRIVIRGDQLPFSYYSRTIVGGTGKNILTKYQVGLEPSTLVSMNYSGTVKGALDLLASKSGYVYSINGTAVYWQAFVTRTYDIAFMPGSTDYMMGKTSSGGAGGVSSPTPSGGSVMGGSSIEDTASQQYSNISGKISVWKDLENTIKQLLSPDGKVVVSEATTTVTVRDRATNVNLVSKYISNLNSNLSRQVLVKVQVLEVQLSSDFNLGINWNAIENAFGHTNFRLVANYGTPIAIIPFTGNPIPFGGLAFAGSGTQSGIQALFNFLNQQGKASVVTEPRIVCLNNQVSALRIITQTGYIASVQTTTLGGSSTSSSGGSTQSTSVNNNTVTSQVTPGNLTTGMTLYILPKILNGKIILQVNADLTNQVGSIQTLSSTTGITPTANATAPIIQVPTVAQKSFNQRSVLRSGDTLILAGFRKISNQANAMQFFDSQTLGGRAATEGVDETVILITPIILNGPGGLG